MYRVALIAGTVAFILGVVLVVPPRWTPSRVTYPSQGIDVSSHQGEIDWRRVGGDGVDFAYVKATEGGDFKDRLFLRNWHSASQAGIKVGAYHFFTLCRSGADQAANYLSTVPDDPNALPAAVDLEFLGNCRSAQKMSPARLHSELRIFLEIVEARTGKPTFLYLTQEFDEAYRVSIEFDRPLWLRRIVFRPRFGARPWTLWQASNFRRIDGIAGRVDWNVGRFTWSSTPPNSQS